LSKSVNFPPLLRAALVAFGVALAVRLAFIIDDVHSPYLAHRLIDELDYHDMATRFARGTWPGSEAIFRPPLYPIFLAAMYRVVGDDVLNVRLTQSALGALAAPLTVIIASRVLGSARLALVAGLAVALLGPLVYYDAQLLTASLDVLLVLASVALILRADATNRVVEWLVAGVVVGVAGTNRGAMLLMIPVVAAWALATRAPSSSRADLAKRLSAFAAAAGLVVLPVAWHNARNDERPQIEYAGAAPRAPMNVATASETLGRLARGRYSALGWADGINLYIGNIPTFEGLNRDSNVAHFDWFNDLTGEPWKHGATTAHEHSEWFKAETRSYVWHHPLAWLRLAAHKALEVVNGYEVPRGLSPYAERKSSAVLSALLWSGPLRFPSGLLFPLGLAGAFALRRDRRSALLALVMIAQLFFVVAFFVTSRYRLPALPLAAVLATGFVARTIEDLRQNGARTRAFAGRVVGVLALVIVANAHLEAQSFERSAIEKFDLARELVNDGNGDEALRYARAAIATAPDFGKAHVLVGFLEQSKGDLDAAIAEYRAAIALDPSYPVAHFDLGGALLMHGDASGALASFLEAQRLGYHDPRLEAVIDQARRRATKP